jgi:C_GCAxxG_C_C family probable redox protein
LSFKDFLEIEGSLIPRLATGFGGGIGRKGSLCGAFTGAIMAIGMKIGRADPKDKEAVAKVYRRCREFWNQFEKGFGGNVCYNIIGFHLDNEEERQKSLTSGGMEKCAALVEKPRECSAIFSMKSTEDIDTSTAPNPVL